MATFYVTVNEQNRVVSYRAAHRHTTTNVGRHDGVAYELSEILPVDVQGRLVGRTLTPGQVTRIKAVYGIFDVRGHYRFEGEKAICDKIDMGEGAGWQSPYKVHILVNYFFTGWHEDNMTRTHLADALERGDIAKIDEHTYQSIRYITKLV